MNSAPAHDEKFRNKYGPWAIVTGASDGIGKEFAISLASKGMNLVLVARREPLLIGLADFLKSKYGVKTQVIACDLGLDDCLQTLIQKTRGIEVGLLVAAAGFGTSGSLISSSIESEIDMLNVNCKAVLVLSHHFGRKFSEQKRGGIVLMSSLLAFQGTALAANYSATKSYIQNLAEGLRIELLPYNVDVLASAPGPIRSGFAKRADMKMTMSAAPSVVAMTTLAALGKKSTVRPGFLSQLLEWALKIMPRSGRVRMMSKIMSDMTRHQHQ